MIPQVFLLICLLISCFLVWNVLGKLYGPDNLARYTLTLLWVVAVAVFWMLPSQLLLGQTNKIITGIGTLAISLWLFKLEKPGFLNQKPKRKLFWWQGVGLLLVFFPFLTNIISNQNGWKLSVFAYNWDNGVHVLLYRSILETQHLPFINQNFGLSASEKNYPFGFHAATAVVSQAFGIDLIQDLETKRIAEINTFLVFILFLYATCYLSLKSLITSETESKFPNYFSQIGIVIVEAALFIVLFWQPVVLSAAFLAGITALTATLVFLQFPPNKLTLMFITPLFILATLAWNPFSLITIPLYLFLLFKIELNLWAKLINLAGFTTATVFLSVLQFLSTSIKIEHLNLPGQIFVLTDVQLCLFSVVLLLSMLLIKTTTKNYFYHTYITLVLGGSLLLFLYQIRTSSGTNYYYYKFFMTIYPAFFVSSIQLLHYIAAQFHKQKMAMFVGCLMITLFILETTHYQEFRNFLIGRFYMHKALYNLHLTHLQQGTSQYQATDLFDYWWGRAFLEPQRGVIKPQ